MGIIRRRKGLDKKKKETTDDDYGIWNPFETIEEQYWERENSNHVIYPEEGGSLDQDDFLMKDIGWYGWMVREAEKVLDKEAELQKLIAAKLGH